MAQSYKTEAGDKLFFYEDNQHNFLVAIELSPQQTNNDKTAIPQSTVNEQHFHHFDQAIKQDPQLARQGKIHKESKYNQPLQTRLPKHLPAKSFAADRDTFPRPDSLYSYVRRL